MQDPSHPSPLPRRRGRGLGEGGCENAVDAIEVIQPGAFTTVQDLGRYGYQKYGVPICGAMDKFALRVANLLVGNAEGEATLEATVVGPKLKALRDFHAAFTGGDLSPEINGKAVPMWRALPVRTGDILSFGSPRSGCRAYLAIGGGIDFALVMGSRSVHTRSGLGGEGRALRKGDILRIQESGSRNQGFYELDPERIPVYGNSWKIRVVFGPQNDYFTRRGIETFLHSEYTITPQSDRMGYRLKGPKIEHKAGADVLTDATPPGSIQVPGDGMPIILLADGQTTGGYPKIAVAATADQDLLGQARPGDKVNFQRITIREAHLLLAEKEERIRGIKEALKAV